MIKDLIVNLSLEDKPDVAANFAASAASTLDAHLMGVSFLYEPVLPTVELVATSADIIEMQREENERVSDTSADFIVMGGYGHSRWRELVLGGVTRGLLASMTVPTLMSH